MDIYNAIMKAADHIERSPQDFNFNAISVPSCGSPGCALGWIGHFMGFEPNRQCGFALSAVKMLGIPRNELPEFIFYARMDKLIKDWRDDPSTCARGLRLYAAKYHAPVVQPPDWNAIASRQTIGEHEKSQELA